MKISELPQISALTGTELIPMDSGTAPNRTTVSATSNTLAAALASGIIGRTPTEIANGVIPVNNTYQPGDVRRYTTKAPVSDFNYAGWFSYGDVPVAVDADTFTVTGDARSRYIVGSHMLLVGTAAIQVVRVSTTAFGGGLTTIDITFDVGGVMPTGLVACAAQQLLRNDGQNTVSQDANLLATGVAIQNKNLGTAAGARFTMSSDPNGGMIGFVVGDNFSGTFFPTQGFNGRCAGFYTTTTGSGGFVPTPMIFAVADLPRLIIDAGAGPVAAPIRLINASETLALHSPLTIGGVYQTWRRLNSIPATRMGVFGYDSLGVNNNLRLINEVSSGGIELTSTSGNSSLNATAGSVSLNGTSYSMTLTGLGNFANDAAAAGGGVPVSGLYRNGSVLQIRVA